MYDLVIRHGGHVSDLITHRSQLTTHYSGSHPTWHQRICQGGNAYTAKLLMKLLIPPVSKTNSWCAIINCLPVMPEDIF
jgi:hypothetical protein